MQRKQSESAKKLTQDQFMLEMLTMTAHQKNYNGIFRSVAHLAVSDARASTFQHSSI